MFSLTSRSAFFSLLLVFAFALPALAQVDIKGVLSTRSAPVPDSRTRVVTPPVTAPGPTNNSRGVTSTATRPAQPSHRTSVHLPVPFGDPHRRNRDVVAIPLFYPVYLYPNQNNAAPEDPQDAPASTDDQALQDAYNRGAQDALAQQGQAHRGQRPADSRDPFAQPQDAAMVESARFVEPEPDSGPATVFIFKDGHRIETKNFAIMGQTLFDFSSKPLRKIQLTDLDIAATAKVNDEMGNSLRLLY